MTNRQRKIANLIFAGVAVLSWSICCFESGEPTEEIKPFEPEEVVFFGASHYEQLGQNFSMSEMHYDAIALEKKRKRLAAKREQERKAEKERQQLSYEVSWLEKCVEAEAGNQGYYGKRAVTAVILNRVRSDRFPGNIVSVIFQKHQFEVVSRGIIYNVYPSEETKRAVHDEIANRSNLEVLFFTAGCYNEYCIPLFKLGDHYFGR